MGTNNPIDWVKELVEKYIDKINGWRDDQAEEYLTRKMLEIKETMEAQPGNVQSKGFMDAGNSEARLLTMWTRDLGRQHGEKMKALDIGTFCGRSAAAMAAGMENGGTVITVDSNDTYLGLAKGYWRRKRVADKIDARVIPAPKELPESEQGAHKVINELLKDPKQHHSFDIIFVDAEKPGYDDYYEKALELLRPGGKVIFDNTLWSGRVVDINKYEKPIMDAAGSIIREGDKVPRIMDNLNNKIMHDRRAGVADALVMDAYDGLTVVEKSGDVKGFVRKLHEEAEKEKSLGHAA